MRDKFTSLRSTFSIGEEITSEDTRFLNVVIDIMHDGENLNGSYFDKEVVNSCIDSIKNTPVLGFIKTDKYTGETDFKGHEYILKRNENGVEEFYIGKAYGVIPESCNPRWVTKVCPDGAERDFLQVDALIWEKFSDATSIIKRDGEKPESMELEVSSVEGYEDENGIFHFTSFRFDGACMLGDDVPPAMVGANVRINDGVNFTMSDITESIRSELNDKIELFNATFAKLTGDDAQNKQGGVNDMTTVDTDFAQTMMEQIEDISIMVSEFETVETCWGTAPRYYLADIQDNEIIVVDQKNYYRYYGFPFTVNGDKPEIDFACGGSRKKVRYENYEEGYAQDPQMFEFGTRISEIEEAANAKLSDAETKVSEFETKVAEAETKVAEAETKMTEAAEKVSELETKLSDAEAKVVDFETKIGEVEQAKSELETNYEQVKSEYDEIKPKYDEFVAAEEKRAAEELSARKDAAFAEFESDLADNADFAALKEKKDDMSVEDIEKECAFLYVKVNRAKNKFSAAGSESAVVGVMNDIDPDKADGLVATKYGYISVGQ